MSSCKSDCEGPCIILYSCGCDRWGEVTLAMLEDILRDDLFGLSFKKIDLGQDESPVDIQESPTIDLCGIRMSGIPDVGIVRNELQMIGLIRELGVT